MAHCLRSRDLNIDRQVQEKKVVTAKGKNILTDKNPNVVLGNKHKNILADDPLKKDEPKAKRPALSDITKGRVDSIKTAVVVSTKPKPQQKRSILSAKEIEAVEELEVDPEPDFDFDKENMNDPSAVSEYACDIFLYYKHREVHYKVVNYFKHHSGVARSSCVNPTSRAAIVDWMVEVQESFELSHETLYMSVKMFDLYLSRCTRLSRLNILYLIGATAVFVSSKVEERSPPSLADLVHLANNSFKEKQLKKMERELLKTVRFDLCAPLSYSFLRRYGRVIQADMKLLTLSRYILETSLHFIEFCEMSDSKIAAASLLLALKMNNLSWTPVLEKYSAYTEKEIEKSCWMLNHMLHTFSKNYPEFTMVKTKYEHPVFYEAAKTSLLPDCCES